MEERVKNKIEITFRDRRVISEATEEERATNSDVPAEKMEEIIDTLAVIRRRRRIRLGMKKWSWKEEGF